ncbi:cobalamin biosynthesis protein CobY [Halobacteriales archaeon QS_1_68_17]|nr:MAG: cobalamin biosynthesis protein CobY [Halobacteriales archaeon QS_1_68_17]
MDALVICGGKGTRLDAPVEKPLFEVCGRPMVDRVTGALAASRVDDVFAVVSSHTPVTRTHVDCPVIETPGDGYVSDLRVALDDPRVSPPVATVVSDLPLLPAAAVDRALAAHDGGSLTVAVPAALKRALGVSVDRTLDRDGTEAAPAGLNVVGDGPERTTVSWDARLAVNVNRRADAAVAERLCADG